jgi:exopolysaccharide production protein ExoZ
MRFHNLQVLRVIAAVGVVLYHLAIHARVQLGVDHEVVNVLAAGSLASFPVPLFFALSGFVLTHALHRGGDRRRFLFGRFLRLYPGYWLAAVTVAILMTTTGLPSRSLPLATQMKWLGWSLRPHEYGACLYVLGVEWSLVYEVFLSCALAGLSLLGLRRALPAAIGLWLAVLIAKVSYRPGDASEPLPNWTTIGLSTLNAPFLMGVLVYYLRDCGRSLRWPALGCLVAFLGFFHDRATTLEELWLFYGTASAVVVWFAIQVRQLNQENPLVRAGDWTYGLYLVHVPVIMSGFAILRGRGVMIGTLTGLLLTGILTLVVGFLYGRIEAEIHARLRPLAKRSIGSAITPLVWAYLRPRVSPFSASPGNPSPP